MPRIACLMTPAALLASLAFCASADQASHEFFTTSDGVKIH